MKKRKYSQIVACLLSATLAGSFICSSIVFASETTSAKIQELNESTVSIENKKEDTETVNPIGDSQVKTTVFCNQEANEIQSFAENNNAGDFNVTGDTSGWTYDDTANTLTVTASGTYTITGNGVATTERIIVSGNSIDATIALNNVNIDVSSMNYQRAFYAKNSDQSNVHLTIILQGTNSVKSGGNCAGITWNNTDDKSTLEIKGEGSLTAIGGIKGAGIGSNFGESGNNITITGGTVTATGGKDGAGIGGGDYSSGNNITITGGTVTATGGDYGAGIGGGDHDTGSNITIEGGTVTATGGEYGAGIGGGYFGSGSNITITGGSVKASSIDTTPIDNEGANIYIFKLENQDNVNEVIVDNKKIFIREGSHPNNDVAFYMYLTGENHDLQIGSNYYKVQYTNGNFTIKSASKPNKPTIAIDTSNITASSITITELADKDTYGGAEYSIDNINWQTNNIFTGLHSNKEYTVYARYKGNDTYVVSDTVTAKVWTSEASYTITIPANPDSPLVAGKEDSTCTISINQKKSFDLGHNGQVNVKIKNDNKVVTEDAKLKLTRQNDAENHTITSALLVNGKALGNINNNVAEFTMSNKEPVSVSFAKPTEKNILAGTYTGTITFEVSYSEQ